MSRCAVTDAAQIASAHENYISFVFRQCQLNFVFFEKDQGIISGNDCGLI